MTFQTTTATQTTFKDITLEEGIQRLRQLDAMKKAAVELPNIVNRADVKEEIKK